MPEHVVAARTQHMGSLICRLSLVLTVVAVVGCVSGTLVASVGALIADWRVANVVGRAMEFIATCVAVYDVVVIVVVV